MHIIKLMSSLAHDSSLQLLQLLQPLQPQYSTVLTGAMVISPVVSLWLAAKAIKAIMHGTTMSGCN